MKKRVDDLIGPELDYWVSRACEARVWVSRGMDGHITSVQLAHPLRDIPMCPFIPSADWEQGGLLIERGRLWISCADSEDGGEWVASHAPHTEGGAADGPPDRQVIFEGPTLLVAAMRAFVAAKFGPEVGDDSVQ